MRTHTGEKTHKCEICGQGLSSKKNLKIHLELHETKFNCDICDHKFENRRGLTNHLKSKEHAKKTDENLNIQN